MGENADFRQILEHNIDSIRANPAAGQGTATTTVRIRNGVTCDIEDGQWKLVGDEMPGDGGGGLGPDPGVFGRAALGTCLAMGYVQWAAHFGVPLDSVDVTVEADYDARGMLGVDESVSPAWSAVRYIVDIASPAGEEKVRAVIDHADRHSPLLADFREPLAVTRELRIARTVSRES
jgi:uncharacterized OsmC-like protein